MNWEKMGSEGKYWLYLAKIHNLEPRRRKFLLDMFGGPKEIYNASPKSLRLCPMLEEKHIEALMEMKKIDFDAEMEFIRERKIELVTREDEIFPEKLRNIPDSPCYLFYKGSLPKDDVPAVAIVGSRKCSFYGREICLDFSRSLALAGVSIISGMAAGIDGFAHRGALDVGGSTFAVVGSGPDICYPTQNRDIYNALTENGLSDNNPEPVNENSGLMRGVISEYYPGTAPLALNFPQRNRIISGFADVLVVVEARMRSGTGITVDHALEQGREIFAVPGRIGDPISDGCNELIKNGAHIATSVEDIIDELKQHYEMLLSAEKRNISNRHGKLSEDEKKILSCLSHQPVCINELAVETGFSCEKLSSLMVELELKDIVEEVGKNAYIKKM